MVENENDKKIFVKINLNRGKLVLCVGRGKSTIQFGPKYSGCMGFGVGVGGKCCGAFLFSLSFFSPIISGVEKFGQPNKMNGFQLNWH